MKYEVVTKSPDDKDVKIYKCYITKWLPAKDLEWLESEKFRLRRKGWNVNIAKRNYDNNGTISKQYVLWRRNRFLEEDMVK